MRNTLDLCGTWQIRFATGQRGRLEYANRDITDTSRYIDAIVPGDVHLDLMRAGLLQEPATGLNVLAARWVEETYWAYRREFDLPSGADGPAVRAWLVFDGLDLVADIFLNDKKVGRHHNSMYPCRVDVTGLLRTGKNVLAVHIESGLYDAADKNNADYEHDMGSRLHKRHWLRKPQSAAEWDWSPRLLNVGIYKPVRLEWSRDQARLDQVVPLVSLDEKLTTGSVRVRAMVEGLSDQTVQGDLEVELVGTGIKSTNRIEIKSGLQPIEATFTIQNPRLWNPVGHGAQHRYELKATIRVSGNVIGTRTQKIGFRHVRINQDKHPVEGQYFNVEVNGRKVFCKGGNFVPSDLILARCTRQRYEALIDRALEANFNFLRIWGGGLYESDDFYELCDERGILVWQDFVFACSKYPLDQLEFFNDVKREVTHNIRRLAGRPSLIIWSGNNEMEEAAWFWGYDKKGKVLPDYHFFHLTLPQILRQEDPDRYYQPSSPWSEDGSSPRSDLVGDQHPWFLGFFDNDVRKYRSKVCRFANEGGSLGPTALPTMLACLPEGQQHVGSFAWQIHDNSIDSWTEPSPANELFEFHIGKRAYDMTVEQFTYWGGLLQGEGLREYCETFRRKAWDCGAAVFWMYNDVWPAVRSWTIIDYYLRRTPAFWAVKRALAPIALALAEEGEEIVIIGMNDTLEPVRGELRFGVFSIDGQYPIDHKQLVELPANSSTAVARFKRSEWTDPSRSAAFATLTAGDLTLARARLFLPLWKELRWTKPDVLVRLESGQAIFSSPVFAWGVCIDLDGETPLSDNFFDLFPGQEYRTPWTSDVAPRVLHVGNL